MTTRSSVRTLAATTLLALTASAAGAQRPSFAGVWVLDSTSTTPTASRTAARPVSDTGSRGPAEGVAPEPAGYRSMMTILQFDTAMVVERRLVDRARRPVASAERISYRLDNQERTVSLTAPSGTVGTATVRARRAVDAAGTPTLLLFTVRRLPLSAERTRTTQLVERLELAPGGALKVTRTEYDGKRERRKVYWFSRA